ncbi:MAG: DUF362 domain-containing protein [Desulfuromonadaceae bacterium]|nr:DUF362 domain-containing protein [Desulfuromonadaceae bacterium]MDD2855730.1 DUF362 domain-containing protein [Desulfuromonadaceae bacterium]
MESVSIVRASGYDYDELKKAVCELLEPLGGINAFVSSGEKVLLKPNMLSGKSPEKAVTTHPVLVQIVSELARDAGGRVVIGDSPGIGGFLSVAEKCGFYEAARKSGAALAEFKDGVELKGGGIFKSIRVARNYYEADKIINLPKLKTHEMMTLTCAVKNLFGAVIGAEKAGWHLKAGTSKSLFARLLLEIYLLKKPALNIVDAIVAMEGDGPSSGTPIKRGILIAGANAVAVDVIAARVAGIPGTLLPIEREAASLGLSGAVIEEINMLGESIQNIPAMSFKLPKGMDVQFGLPPLVTRIMKSHLTSYPAADHSICILCGICRDACPPVAIKIRNSALSVDKSRCIRCWCCRELCPHNAMGIKSGRLLRVLKKLSGKSSV